MNQFMPMCVVEFDFLELSLRTSVLSRLFLRLFEIVFCFSDQIVDQFLGFGDRSLHLAKGLKRHYDSLLSNSTGTF